VYSDTQLKIIKEQLLRTSQQSDSANEESIDFAMSLQSSKYQPGKNSSVRDLGCSDTFSYSISSTV